MGKSIKQLQGEISRLQRNNKELEERKALEEKLERLKHKLKPKKPSRVVKVQRKIRGFLGPVAGSFDRAFG